MNENNVSQDYEISLSEIIGILLSNLRMIFLLGLIFAVIIYLINVYLISPTYKASVSMYVNNNKKVTSESINYNDISASQKLVDTYIEIIKSRTVLNAILEDTGLDYTCEELSDMIETSQLNETEIFTVSVKNKSPEEATNIANSIADIAVNKILEFVEASSVKIVDYAEFPDKPYGPRVKLNTFIGFCIGVFIGIMVSFILEFLNTKIYSEDDLEKLFDAPIIGIIPEIRVEENE